MSHQKHRLFWLIPAIIAVVSFLGSMTANMLASTQWAGDFAEEYALWLWGFTFLAVLITVAGVIYDTTRISDTGGPVLSGIREYERWRNAYLQRVVRGTQQLPLATLYSNAASAETREHERLHLQDVYIDLDTKTPRRKDGSESAGKPAGLPSNEGQISALEALITEKHLVLTGEPGGGKSTFLNYVAFCLAENTLDSKVDWIAHLPGWPQEWATMIPVLIPLRDVSAWFQNAQPHQREAGLFDEFLEAWLKKDGLSDFYKPLCAHLKDGTALLMLDGLDEVPVSDEVLERIKEMIAALPEALPSTRIVVTCRILSYDDPRWKLDGKTWPVCEIAPFTFEKIDDFIEAWYTQLEAMQVVTAAAGRRDELKDAVRRPDLYRLSPNPLLLTAMALLHTVRSGRLPGSRAKLYEEVVDLLLWRWEDTRITAFENRTATLHDLLDEARVTETEFKRLLWQLAYDAHAHVKVEDGPEATYDIPRDTLREAVSQLPDPTDLNWAQDVIDAIQRRAGLLIPGAPGCFKFPHRTFQEYLAGCHLSSQIDFTERALTLSAQGVFWREVILLAVGRMTHVGDGIERPLVLVSELCPVPQPADDKVPAWRNVWLAGDCILEIGLSSASKRAIGPELIARVREQLCYLVMTGQMSARERAAAGSTLSAIGDPRDFEEFVPVPAGPFMIGSTDGDELARVGEKPQHQLQLDAFLIGKFPVTNQQYAGFVEATGKPPPAHWNGSKTPPERWRNHPVVNVSWHDARAYCAWKSSECGAEVRLPTEAEWEKAARGTDERLYPWGDTPPTPEYCNFDMNIGGTTAVGMYPLGESPWHAMDMSGNVWEWVNDWYQSNYYATSPDTNPQGPTNGDMRIVRGGSWDYDLRSVRASTRGRRRYPGHRYDYIGFRCVRSQ